MKFQRFACLMLSWILVFSLSVMPVEAASKEIDTADSVTMISKYPRASNSFSTTVPAKTIIRFDTSFSLVAGETVTFRASYAPGSSSVDFGLIAPNGTYYYFNVTSGSINKTMRVSETGNYTLQIRNNSYYGVEVAGVVDY